MSVNTATSPQSFGVTPPISLAKPTEKDEEIAGKLLEELRQQSAFEIPEEIRTRESAISQVEQLLNKFIKRVGLAQGLPEDALSNIRGKVLTFGSYRLGVHDPGTTIDILCVAPRHVPRHQFFELFEPMLKGMEGVTRITGVPDAYVPIIQADVYGVLLDILFARVDLPTVPSDLSIEDDNLLRNLDERCIRSLNGPRVNDEILRSVPNVEVFRSALRCVRLWAQRRAILSNVHGFLGGVSWAIIVARICQLYPNGNVWTIISRFFFVMAQWTWPQPVLLKYITDGPLAVRVWNPRLYPSDRGHRMPVITPSYPAMCSTHNVNSFTQQIITEELKRGTQIAERIAVGQAGCSELFTRTDFFKKYRYYLQIIVSSIDAQLQVQWARTVESRLRQLVMKLEFVEHLGLAHPFIHGFEQTFYCMSEQEMLSVGKGEVPDEVDRRNQEDIEGVEGAATVYTTTFYVGLQGVLKTFLNLSSALPKYVHNQSQFEEAWARLRANARGRPLGLGHSDPASSSRSEFSFSQYSLASSRTATTDYGIYFTRWAISQETLESAAEPEPEAEGNADASGRSDLNWNSSWGVGSGWTSGWTQS